jgi:hypothetical protein
VAVATPSVAMAPSRRVVLPAWTLTWMVMLMTVSLLRVVWP